MNTDCKGQTLAVGTPDEYCQISKETCWKPENKPEHTTPICMLYDFNVFEPRPASHIISCVRKMNGWNLKINHLERRLIFKTSTFGFHVYFLGCTLPETSIAPENGWLEYYSSFLLGWPILDVLFPLNTPLSRTSPVSFLRGWTMSISLWTMATHGFTGGNYDHGWSFLSE